MFLPAKKRIGIIVWVSRRTMCLFGVHRTRTIATKRVLLLGDGFEMVWIHTRSAVAAPLFDVVDDASMRNPTTNK